MTGPSEYKIAKDADLTVMMWVKGRVEANHAYAKGKFSKDEVKTVASDTDKILN